MYTGKRKVTKQRSYAYVINQINHYAVNQQKPSKVTVLQKLHQTLKTIKLLM